MPKQIDHEQRRREIVAATWRSIDELGVHGTSMRAIAERAGCTTGRLSHYFDNRDSMLLAALRQAHTQAARRMAEALVDHAGRDRLRAVLLEALPLDEVRRVEWKVWITFWAEAISAESLRNEHRQRYREWNRLVRDLVAGAAPDRTRAEIDRISVALVALVDGLGLQASVGTEQAASRRVLRTLDSMLDQLLAPTDRIAARRRTAAVPAGVDGQADPAR